MKGLYCCIGLLTFFTIIAAPASGQTITSSGAGSGLWSDPASWSPNTVPDAGNSTSVIINSGHSITVDDATRSIDQLTVSGTLVINSGSNFTILNNASAQVDLLVSSGARIDNKGTLTITNGFGNQATVQIDGTLDNSNAIAGGSPQSLIFSSTGSYIHNRDGGVVPTASWHDSSTCTIMGTINSMPTGLSQMFGSFIWNTPSLAIVTPVLALTGSSSFDGTFSIEATNGQLLVLSDAASVTINVNNFTVSGTALFAVTNSGSVTLNVNGTFNYSSSAGSFFANIGTGKINQKGNFIFSAGTLSIFDATGNGTLTFNAPSTQNPVATFDNTGGGSFVGIKSPNITIAAFSKLRMIGESYFDGSGTFTAETDATFGVSSADGLTTSSAGNVRTTVKEYKQGSNIRYILGSSQNLGSEWGAGGLINGVAVNLEIDNGSVVTNNNVGSTNLIGKLTISNGRFNIGGANTLNIKGEFVSTADGVFGGSTASNLTFSGTGGASTVNFAPEAAILKDLTISRAQTMRLGTDVTIHGTLSFSNNGKLDISGVTLSLDGNGDITASSGGLVSLSSNPGSLVLGGEEALTSVPFSGSGNTLNDVTFSRGGTSPSYSWANSVIINQNLYLDNGVLTNSTGAIILADQATIHRSAGSFSAAGSSPAALGTYNLVYSGDMTTGLELSSSADLNNIEVTGVVTLDKDVTVKGNLLVSGGSFNAGLHTVNVEGPAFTVNAGTFTTSGPVNFIGSGTTIIGGTGINDTQFANLSIVTGRAVSAPNANIKVSGTWDNQGVFTANTGTVTFNGTNQNLDPNGQPFNNVVFANGGTKSLAGNLVVNGSLTINSGVTLDAASSDNAISIAGTWSNSGTFVPSGNTVTFNGTAQTITEAGSFFDLALSGSGTKTLGSALAVDHNLVINSGVTLATGASFFPITLGGNWTNDGSFTTPGNTGTITFNNNSVIGGNSLTRFRNVVIAGAVTAPSALEVAGNWSYTSGSFNANNGTVTFNGNIAQAINSGGQAFYNLAIAGNSTKTLSSSLEINGNLLLNAGTLAVQSNNVNLAGNFDASGGGVLSALAGQFIFDGDAQSVTSAGQSFFNVMFGGSGTKTLVDAFDVNGDIDLQRPISAGANSIHVSGNWNATIAGGLTSTGTTTFDGAGQTIRSNGSSFGTIVLNGSGTKALQDALDANGSLTVTTATLSAGTNTITVGGDWNTFAGTFAPGTGSIILDGATQNITLGANSFNNLTVAGTGTKTQQDPLDINGNLLISSALSAGSNNNITLAGNITTNGSYTPGTSTLTLDGTGAQSLAGSTATNYNNITVNKSSGTATVSTNQILTNTLRMAGGTFNANGRLTLVSSAAGDARIAEITGGTITGKVIAQRYLPVSSTLPTGGVYRYLASPVTDAFVSEWKDDFPITGNFNDPSTAAQWPGLNVTSSARNMFFYNEAHTPTTTAEDRFESYPLPGTSSTTSPLVNGVGYSARVRQTTPIVLDVTGTPQQGPVPVTVTSQMKGPNDGNNFVGNPYPAPINWDNVTLPEGVSNSIYMKDNTGTYVSPGNFIYYVQNDPDASIPQGYSGTIASGQAFQVRSTVASAVITFQEDDKEEVSTQSFIRKGAIHDILRISVAGNGNNDEMLIRFSDLTTDRVDNTYDALKFKNDFINLASYSSDSIQMAINVLGSLDCNKEVGVTLTDVTPGSYTFSFSQFDSFDENISLRLLDNFTGETFEITNAHPNYQFAVTDDVKSFGRDRFRMYFAYPTVQTNLVLETTNVCTGSDGKITLKNSQKGVKYYSVIGGEVVSETVESNGGDLNLTISGTKLGSGENNVVVMAGIGGCNAVPLDDPAIIRSGNNSEVSVLSEGKSCGEGQVVLQVSGAPAGGSYKWYETQDATNSIEGQVSSEFTTPVLNKSKTYFVATVDGEGCEGGRSAVQAHVVLFDSVHISIEEQKLISSYSTGNQWYFNGNPIQGATGQSLDVTESGLYEVEVNINGCSARTSQEMIILGAETPYGQGFNFFPNPVESRLQIELPGSTPATGKVLSPIGQALGDIDFKVSGGKMKGEYDFRGQPAGVYFIKVFQGNTIINQKIIRK